MRKTGLLCVIAVASMVFAAATARADICRELHVRLTQLELADQARWEDGTLPGDPYAIERQRSEVLRMLAANRCPGPQAQRDNRPGRLLAGLFGNKRPARNGARFNLGRLFGPGSAPGVLAGGTYRTLCVRSCDGYYFPISFSAAGSDLKRDAAACTALCPGQEVSLYVQQNPGEDGNAMVSLAGEPYAMLPTAYLYRARYDRTCSCGPVDAATAAAFEVFAVPAPNEAAALEGTVAQAPGIPAPRLRLRHDDPDTMANRDGRLAVANPAEPPLSVTGSAYGEGPDGRTVRLVGPALGYLPQ